MKKTIVFWLGLAAIIVLGVWSVFTAPIPPDQVPVEDGVGIRIEAPIKNTVVRSPLVIRGEARGPWFFEASFPIELRDANDDVIATSFVQAQDNWMTEEFVYFEGKLIWEDEPETTTGYIYLRPDDPSGGESGRELPDLRWPVEFE